MEAGRTLQSISQETSTLFEMAQTMTIKLKQVKPLGFKGNGVYPDSAYHSHYYKVDAKAKTVTVIGNLYPQTISRFELTSRQLEAFDVGKLKLVPPHCVSPGPGRSFDKCKILFEGDIKNLRHLKKIFEVI